MFTVAGIVIKYCNPQHTYTIHEIIKNYKAF